MPIAAPSFKSCVPPLERSTSLADLFDVYACEFCVVSSPENGLDAHHVFDGGFTAPVMKGIEKIPENLAAVKPWCLGKERVPSLTNLVDFAGSSSANFCNSRIRHVAADGTITYCKDDWSRDLQKAFPDKEMDETEHLKLNIEHSTWLSYWHGKVSGGLTATFASMDELTCSAMPTEEKNLERCEKILNDAQVPYLGNISDDDVKKGTANVRMVVMISVDGGPITQVEKTHLPPLGRDVLSDLRRRKYKWACACQLIWAHFPSIWHLCESLRGKRNLVPDEDPKHVFAWDTTGSPMTLRAVDKPVREDAPRSLDLIPDAFLDEVKHSAMFEVESVKTAILNNDVGTLKFIAERERGKEDNLLLRRFTDDSIEVSPLHYAAVACNVDCVKVLVNEGADLSSKTGNAGGWGSLSCMLCAIMGYQLGACTDTAKLKAMMDYLFENGASVDADEKIAGMNMGVVDFLAVIYYSGMMVGQSNNENPGLRNPVSFRKMQEELFQINLRLSEHLKEKGGKPPVFWLFKQFDKDADGFISPDDLYNAMGKSLSREKVTALIQEGDKDDKGKMAFVEFFAWFNGPGEDKLTSCGWRPSW
eukprot:TRINITY_DN63006_c0_g1_i1.p1 TRINITY_DN63006_c0_g1~~TRINITY_DN63006_c0_g1_i1.p1  ORF type:complete len:590 (-),score=92.44 TRINITY_DN63006_c0_g1_i1:125-1894(-)